VLWVVGPFVRRRRCADSRRFFFTREAAPVHTTHSGLPPAAAGPAARARGGDESAPGTRGRANKSAPVMSRSTSVTHRISQVSTADSRVDVLLQLRVQLCRCRFSWSKRPVKRSAAAQAASDCRSRGRKSTSRRRRKRACQGSTARPCDTRPRQGSRRLVAVPSARAERPVFSPNDSSN
jgi:hypothetical protein